MKIANINNLSLVSVAMERLVNRQDGLPGLGVLYGPSGFGKTTATVAVANETRAYYVQLRRPALTMSSCAAHGAKRRFWKRSASRWACRLPGRRRVVWM